ncbi:hypothetical protein [Magnetococcus sp. PR-3]|uniref:hypothetical protein n=1 Tax=Magnetococcus sp. PR-3 TaxID=3120355 RepID=UPI002FCE0959
MDKFEQRRVVLLELYKGWQNNPSSKYVDYNDLLSRCGFKKLEFDQSASYLHEAGYIEYEPVLGLDAFFSHAQITLSGIDLVEEPNEFNRMFPAIEQNIEQHINVSGSMSGPIQGAGVIHGNSGDASSANCLELLRQKIEESSEISEDEKLTLLGSISRLTAHPAIAAMLGGIVAGLPS